MGASWRQKATNIFVIIGPGNGLTAESMLIIVYCTLRNKLHWNLNQSTTVFIQEYAFEMFAKFRSIFRVLNELN